MTATGVRGRAATGLSGLAVVLGIAFLTACGEDGPEPAADAPAIFVEGVDQVMIGGEIVYERAKDKRLKKLLEKPEEIQEPQDND